MNSIPFTKTQGCGNDFVTIDNRDGRFSLEQLVAVAPTICDRKLGVGADGLLVLNKPTKPNTDFEMIYRNADGSDAGMCGNGGRCIAYFASSLGMPKQMKFSVHDGLYSATVKASGVQLEWLGLTVKVEKKHLDNPQKIELYQLNTGTDHVVLLDQDLSSADYLVNKGATIRYNKDINPIGTNVNFIATYTGETISSKPQVLEVVTYERGVEDLTLACGTGALASAITWHFANNNTQIENTIIISMPGGALSCDFNFDNEANLYLNLKLTGSTKIVFNGVYLA